MDGMIQQAQTFKPWSGTDLKESEKKALVRELNAQHSKMRNAQKEARRRWTKLESYVQGRQIWDESKKRAVGHEIAGASDASGDVDAEFTIVNDMRRIHVSNVQRLTSYSINVSVVPNSKAPEDKAGARLGRIALADMFRNMGEEKFKKRVARIIGVYGTVFFKVYFDPTKGRLIHPARTRPAIDPLTGEPTGEDEAYIDESIVEPEGQVVIEAVSPRNVLLPKFASELEKVDELEEVRVETCDYIYRRWGVVVAPEDIGFDEWDSPEAVDTEQDDVELDRTKPEKSAVVKSRYIRPCPRYPKGAIFVYTREVLLHSSTLTDYFDDIPWYSAEAIYDDRSVFGDSWLWDLIPLQDSLNETVSAMVRHIKMYGDQKLFIPSQANIDPDKISNATAEHIVFEGEKPPSFMNPPELQQTHFNVFNLIRQLEMSLGAAHDIARTSRALSGNAIANLQEIDDTVLRPALRSIEEALQNACRMALKLMAEYYTTARLVKMSGMQGWQIEEDFVGEMLNNNFYAIITLMSGLPSNKAFRLEYLRTLHKEQLIDRDEARVYLEFGNTDEMLEAIQKENEIADNIVRDLSDPLKYVNGEPTSIPHTFDNHELVAKKLIQFMRENYDHQPEEIKRALKARLDFHQQFMAATAMPTPGAGPAPEMMDPTQGMTGNGMGLPPNLPEGPALQDSNQNASQQPPRGGMLPPAVTGMRAS